MSVQQQLSPQISTPEVHLNKLKNNKYLFEYCQSWFHSPKPVARPNYLAYIHINITVIIMVCFNFKLYH